MIPAARKRRTAIRKMGEEIISRMREQSVDILKTDFMIKEREYSLIQVLFLKKLTTNEIF